MTSAYASAVPASAVGGEGDRELSLQDLLDLKVEVASKTEEDVAEAPGVVTVITRREIENFDAINLVNIFNRAPGTQQVGSHLWVQSKPVMRGFLITHSDHHVLVLINGRPFRDALGATNSLPLFTSFPVDLIERIEIVRGPGSVLYGSHAMSGVINIITREAGEDPVAKATAGAGSYGGKLASAATLFHLGDFKATVGGNYFSEDGWDFRARTLGPAGTQRDSSKQYAEDNRGAAAFLEYKRAKAQIVYTETRYEELGLLPRWQTAGHTTASRLFADLGYVQPFSEGWDFSVNVTYNHQEFSVVDALYREEVSHGILAEGTLRGRVGEKAHIVAGGLTEHLANGEPLPFVAGKQASGIPFQYSEQHVSGYLSADYRPFEPLKLIAGLQYHLILPDCDVASAMSDTLSRLTGAPKAGCPEKQDLVPRFGAIHTFNEDVSLKLLYGRAFRAATPLEEFTILPNALYGNPGLQAEYVTTYDAQLLVDTDKAQHTFTLYHSHLEDIIARRFVNPGVAGDLRQTFANADRYYLFGAEMETRVPISERWYGTGSMTYQREYRDRLFIPDFMAKAGIFHESRDFSAGLFGSLFGRGIQARDVNPATLDLNPPAEPIFLLSLSLKYDLRALTGVPVVLEGYGTNLFDDPMHYPEFSRNEVNTLPLGPGRTLYGRVSVKI